MATTRQAFREKIEYQLADTGNNVWSDADLNSYIQEGYSLFVSQALPFWAQAYLNDRADTALADLPSTFLKVDRVLWDYREIDELTPAQLRVHDAQYRTLTGGTILGYVLEQEAVGKLRKYPVPAANCPTDDTDSLNTRLDYYQAASTLSSDVSTFDCPDWCLKYIRVWVLHRAYGQKGKGQDLKLADHFLKRFQQGIVRLLRRKARVGSERISVMGGAAGQRFVLPTPRLPWQFGKVVKRFE